MQSLTGPSIFYHKLSLNTTEFPYQIWSCPVFLLIVPNDKPTDYCVSGYCNEYYSGVECATTFIPGGLLKYGLYRDQGDVPLRLLK